MCSLSKEQSTLLREIIQNAFFFSELCPFFNFRLFILYQAPNSQAFAPTSGALVILECTVKACLRYALKGHSKHAC